MKPKLFSIGLISFFVSTASLAHLKNSEPSLANTNISQTCKDFRIKRNQLSAFCIDLLGDFVQTKTVMHGLENINGQLVKSDTDTEANFHESCKKLSVDAYGFLSASCKTYRGSWIRTSIDLATFLINANGSLVDKRFPTHWGS